MNMNTFTKSEKIGLFIDGANWWETTKQLDFKPDYKVMLEWFKRTKGDIRKAGYYTGVVDDNTPSTLIPMLDFLEYNGWDVLRKPAKVWVNERTGVRKVKCDIDLELALDVIDACEFLDHVYLFSGDGDFAPLVKYIQKKGVRVTVVSSIKTTPFMCADELRRQANHFLDVFDLKVLERQ